MPDNELFIYFKMVDQASGVARKAGATMRQEIDKTAKAQDQSDKAYVRAIKLQERAYKDLATSKTKIDKEQDRERKKSEDDYVRAQKTRANAIAKIAKDEASGQKKTAAELQAFLKQLYAEATSSAKAASSAKAKSAKDASKAEMQDEANKHRLVMADWNAEQAAAKKASSEKTKATKAAYRAEMQDEANKHRLAMMNWAAEQQAIKDNAGALGVAGDAVMGYIGAFASIGTVISGIKAVSEYFAQIKRDTIDAVKEMNEFRESVLQVAAMKDQLGQTTPETVAQMDFRAKTIQTQQAAGAFLQHAEGAGQAAVGANVTRGNFEDAKVFAGKIQTMENSDPAAAADLLGTYALEAKNEGKDLKQSYAHGFKTSLPGKFSSLGQFAKERAEVSPYVTGGAISGKGADTYLSILSLTHPGEAATLFRQGMTASSADFLRSRKMKMLPGMEGETSAQYYQKLGVTDQMTPMDRLLTVGKDLNEQEANEKAAGRNFVSNDYLIKHGITNEQSRMGYQAMAAVQKNDQWEKTFKPMMTNDVNLQEIEDAHKSFVTRDAVGKERAADISRTGAAAIRAGGPEGILQAYQKQEFNKLFANKKITGTFEEWQKRGPLESLSDDLFFGNYHSQVNDNVQERLLKEADLKGIDTEEFTHARKYGTGQRDHLNEAQTSELAQKVESAGGQVLMDGAKMVLKAGHLFLDAMSKSAPGPPLAVAPGARADGRIP